MYTGKEIFDISISIMDELSENGTVSDNYVREYKNRAPALLDIWQKERPGILKTFSIVRKPMENLLGLRFEPTIHQNEDVIFRANEPAYSAVFSVADQAVVYIEEFNGGWVGVSGYYSMDGEETEFSGSITITDSAQVKCRFNSSGDVRIRFSGNYYYLLYNVALYSASFPTCAKVPDYGEYVKYEMPDDFNDISEIVEEVPRAGLHHRWENNKDLYVNYDYDGIIKITYKAVPEKITSLDQTLEVDETLATTGAYFLAEWFAMSDMNTELAKRCREKYDELRARLVKRRPKAQTRIRDVYGIGQIR